MNNNTTYLQFLSLAHTGSLSSSPLPWPAPRRRLRRSDRSRKRS
jgi:hypothetical protein